MTDEITPTAARRALVLKTARQLLDLCRAHAREDVDEGKTLWVLDIWLSEFARESYELRERDGLITPVIEANCRDAALQYDRDVHLHHHRKEDAWTITVGNREVHATAPEASGYGKSIEAAMKSMRPLSKIRKRARILMR
jgi:hypothetical protein